MKTFWLSSMFAVRRLVSAPVFVCLFKCARRRLFLQIFPSVCEPESAESWKGDVWDQWNEMLDLSSGLCSWLRLFGSFDGQVQSCQSQLCSDPTGRRGAAVNVRRCVVWQLSANWANVDVYFPAPPLREPWVPPQGGTMTNCLQVLTWELPHFLWLRRCISSWRSYFRAESFGLAITPLFLKCASRHFLSTPLLRHQSLWERQRTPGQVSSPSNLHLEMV